MEGVDRVGVDDRAGMLALARHLTGLGHRRIGVLCMRLGAGHHDGPADRTRQEHTLYPVQRDRLAGLRDGLAEVGVDWAEVPVMERFYHSVEAGERATAEPCSPRTPRSRPWSAPPTCSPSAPCGTPRSRGSRCRTQLTVTGFDGVPEAERAGLTTVRQPVLEKGRVAGQLLLQRGDRNRPRRVSLPTELIVGTTSAPPREDEKFFSGW